MTAKNPGHEHVWRCDYCEADFEVVIPRAEGLRVVQGDPFGMLLPEEYMRPFVEAFVGRRGSVAQLDISGRGGPMKSWKSWQSRKMWRWYIGAACWTIHLHRGFVWPVFSRGRTWWVLSLPGIVIHSLDLPKFYRSQNT